MTETQITDGVYPVLALRDIVVFPNIAIPLFIGREKTILALENAMEANKNVLLLAQKDAAIENPQTTDLYTFGTLARVLQMLKLPDGTVKILIEGISRAKVITWTQNPTFFEAEVQLVAMNQTTKNENPELLMRSLIGQLENYAALSKRLDTDVFAAIYQLKEPEHLANVVASHLHLPLEKKQALLEITVLSEEIEALFTELEKEIEVLQVERKIRKRVKRQMDKSQREYYLNEQMKAIQKELGDADVLGDVHELEKKIKVAGMPPDVKEKAMGELKKLQMTGPMSSEATVIRNYLDWLIDTPWKKESKLQDSLEEAKNVLDADHFGLEKVKERILEFLAVQKRTKSLKGTILCLVGPPGVGKTSLGQSIARATGRAFIRASLGGVKDEAEIRGHRRTYIGAMPGKIIQNMKKAKTINPLFLLDEIDKLGNDYRGDPASALLEVLDPAQNNTFNDHYLEVDYDLSKVMFITTANTLNMPRPLLDRLEIIHLSGYTEDEKVQIAVRHLFPKILQNMGLAENELSMDESALRTLIRNYTRESGVRHLERELENIVRKVVKEIQLDDTIKSVHITDKNLKKYAGVLKYTFGVAEKTDQIGITTGLAWTEVGGEILSIEAVRMAGKGKITLTGQLGDVMKESVEAAHSFVRSKAEKFGINLEIFGKSDIHVHVPEGATPKDGPSAGIAMMTSLVSAYTDIPVKKDVAMTGEITLRGRVLPIGGLKEKLLAALRAGIKTVLIPAENEKDLEEIPDNVKQGLKLIPVSEAEEVLKYALAKKLKNPS